MKKNKQTVESLRKVKDSESSTPAKKLMKMLLKQAK